MALVGLGLSRSRPIENARLRPVRLRTIRLRPAGRNRFDFGQLAEIDLAEVEIGRSRNQPAENEKTVFALFLSFFFSFALSLLFFFFLVLTHLSLHFFLFLFRLQTPELNRKPQTLHPISDRPFRWTPPPVNQPPPDNPPPDNPPPDRPKISLFSFPPPATIFILSSSLGGRFVEFWWCD